MVDYRTRRHKVREREHQPSITLGFSSHRIESLPFAKRLMENHEVIITEEAPNPKFKGMLNREISINDYISTENVEFTKFSRRMYKLLREFYQKGRTILQIEPYMEHLMQIYDMFSEGKEPSDVLKITGIREVYESERKATGALLSYYESSMRDSFPEVIGAVKRFARADAERFRLRDKMRAQAIATILPKDKMVYVEAGAMHIYLINALRKIVGKRRRITSVFLLEPVVKKLTGKSKLVAPGDLLTIHYMLCRKDNEEYETLQAARSLIYIQLLEKEEMIPTRFEKAPHVKNVITVTEMVNKLTLAQCEELYKKIRFLGRPQISELLQTFLKQDLPSP